MSNVPDETDNQPGEFVDDPQNEPGQQGEAPPEQSQTGSSSDAR